MEIVGPCVSPVLLSCQRITGNAPLNFPQPNPSKLMSNKSPVHQYCISTSILHQCLVRCTDVPPSRRRHHAPITFGMTRPAARVVMLSGFQWTRSESVIDRGRKHYIQKKYGERLNRMNGGRCTCNTEHADINTVAMGPRKCRPALAQHTRIRTERPPDSSWHSSFMGITYPLARAASPR